MPRLRVYWVIVLNNFLSVSFSWERLLQNLDLIISSLSALRSRALLCPQKLLHLHFLFKFLPFNLFHLFDSFHETDNIMLRVVSSSKHSESSLIHILKLLSLTLELRQLFRLNVLTFNELSFFENVLVSSSPIRRLPLYLYVNYKS